MPIRDTGATISASCKSIVTPYISALRWTYPSPRMSSKGSSAGVRPTPKRRTIRPRCSGHRAGIVIAAAIARVDRVSRCPGFRLLSRPNVRRRRRCRPCRRPRLSYRVAMRRPSAAGYRGGQEAAARWAWRSSGRGFTGERSASDDLGTLGLDRRADGAAVTARWHRSKRPRAASVSADALVGQFAEGDRRTAAVRQYRPCHDPAGWPAAWGADASCAVAPVRRHAGHVIEPIAGRCRHAGVSAQRLEGCEPHSCRLFGDGNPRKSRCTAHIRSDDRATACPYQAYP